MCRTSSGILQGQNRSFKCYVYVSVNGKKYAKTTALNEFNEQHHSQQRISTEPTALVAFGGGDNWMNETVYRFTALDYWIDIIMTYFWLLHTLWLL